MRAGVAAVALLTGLIGERILGSLVRAMYGLTDIPVLNDVLFRSRSLYDGDYYAALIEWRLLGAVPLLLVGGLVLLIVASPAAGRIADPLALLADRAARHPALMLGVMILLSVALRSGTIAVPSLIDWDENTFLTVAQRLSVGELPFVETLDNKPPLLAVQHSVPFLIGLSHPSWIRLVLAVLVGVTGALVGVAVRAAGGTPVGALLAAAVLVVGASAAPSGGAWMSHHSANLLLALLMLLALRPGAWSPVAGAVAIGALAAAITLTRTNYVVPAGLVALALIRGEAPRERSRGLALMALGALGVAALVAAPYAAIGRLENLRYGLFDLLVGSGGRVATAGGLPAVPLWLPPLLLLSLLLWVRARRPHLPVERSEVGAGRGRASMVPGHDVSAVAMLGVVISLFLHASMYDHYAGMLMVPLAIQAGLAARGPDPAATAGRSASERPTRRLLAPVAALSALMLLLSGSNGLVATGASRATWSVEEQVVSELASRIRSDPGRVLALDHHYVYWRLGVAPSAPFAVHPSNIVVEAFWRGARLGGMANVPSSPFEAVTAVLDGRPKYLISNPDPTAGYLAEALTEAELDLARRLIDGLWRVVWTSSDGQVAIRECASCD